MMSEDLPIIKKPTRKNLKCILASVGLIIFIVIVITVVTIIFTQTTNNNDLLDEYNSQNETNITENILITRKKWQSQNITKVIPKLEHPAKYVVICHTVGRFCKSFDECSYVLQWMQNSSMYEKKHADIPYNFLIGGDGNIYEGRGWNYQNQLRLVKTSIGVAFIGNYVFYDHLTEAMINATNILLKTGVEQGYLDEDYLLLAQNHTSNTQSPGENIYKEIKKWKHFSSLIMM